MQDDLSQCPLVYFTVEDAVVVYFWDCRVFEKYFQRTRKLQKSCGGWKDTYVTENYRGTHICYREEYIVFV